MKVKNKQLEKSFFNSSKEIMIVPDTDTKGNFLNKYLLVDRKHYLECKDKNPHTCNLFNMDRETLKKGETYFRSNGKVCWSSADWDFKIKVSDRNLTLEHRKVDLNGWIIDRTVTYKESLKLNRYYNSDYYGVKITPFWYEKLSSLKIIK